MRPLIIVCVLGVVCSCTIIPCENTSLASLNVITTTGDTLSIRVVRNNECTYFKYRGGKMWYTDINGLKNKWILKSEIREYSITDEQEINRNR